jgi:hypothetical protein
MVAEMELAQIAEKLGVEPELLLVYWFLLGVIGGAITTSKGYGPFDFGFFWGLILAPVGFLIAMLAL